MLRANGVEMGDEDDLRCVGGTVLHVCGGYLYVCEGVRVGGHCVCVRMVGCGGCLYV